MADSADYAWLVTDSAAQWLSRAAEDPRPALQQLESLRRDLSADRARLIVEQTDLRRRGQTKFGDLAARMFFTPVHLEQATDRWIGQYKAERMAAAYAAGGVMHDFCCGIGGDLMWLAAERRALGHDLSEVACLFAAANVQACGREAAIHNSDVASAAPNAGERWHVDPDRRTTGGRATAVERYSPPPEVIDAWLARSPDGAVKLAPAAEAPNAWAPVAELQWITCQRECRQQVVWFGALTPSPGTHRATVIVDNHGGPAVSGDFVGQADVPLGSVTESRQFLYDPDSSVLAAGLLGALASHHDLHSLGQGNAYLTGDQPLAEPLLQGFAIIDVLPPRAATVAQLLATRGVGRVEIKKRGVTTDPEKFRRALKLRGDDEATVILTRIGKREVALICQRLPPAAGVTEPPPVS